MKLKALLIAASVLLVPVAASAHDHGNGHGYGYGYGHYRPRVVVVPRYSYPVAPYYNYYEDRRWDDGWNRGYPRRWRHWKPRHHRGHHGHYDRW